MELQVPFSTYVLKHILRHGYYDHNAYCSPFVGCIKFLESYYLILVTKRRQIGCICGHAIYGIDETQMIAVPHVSIQTDAAHSKTELRYLLPRAHFFLLNLCMSL